MRRLIAAEANALGLDLSAGAIDGLERLAELFLKWNARINLAAVRSRDELVERHFVDAFAASRFIPPAARVVDVGSGGGLPALPLALAREDLTMALFEPIHKKVAFLRTAVRELGLGSRMGINAEAVGTPVPPALDKGFEVAMSRATLEPDAWLALGRRLIRPPSGRVLVFTTIQSSGGLPPALESLSYGRSRLLLAFGGGEPG